MSTPKIVHLTSVHPVMDNRIFHKECKTLTQAGYEVVLVAPGAGEEVVDKVRIRPVPKPTGRFERVTRTLWSILKAAFEEKAALYHFHDPELILVAWVLKLAGKRVVYDVHEDVPLDILSKYWIPKWARRATSVLVRWVEAATSRVLDGVVTATPQIGRRFGTARRLACVQNFIPTEEVLTSTSKYDERPQLAVYVGAITEVRGIKEMVRAVDLARRELRLHLAGTFAPPELELEVSREPGWKKVEYSGWQSRAQVKALLSSARVGLVTLHAIPSHIESQPIKLFEYMAAGIPVIASDFPLWRDIISACQCGLLVPPDDPHQIALALEWILENPRQAAEMGERGRMAVIQRYNWKHESDNLLKLYSDILRR